MTDQPIPTPAFSQASPPGPARRPSWRWRRTALIGVLGVAAILAAVIGWQFYRAHLDDLALGEAIAEADRLDPGWRLDELEARRAAIPAAQNSATHVNNIGRKAIAILNTGTIRADLRKIDEELTPFAPTARLTERQIAALRATLTAFAGPIADARKIAAYSDGRHPFSTAPTFSTPIPHVDHANLTIWLLVNDIRLQIQLKDSKAAWKNCRAMLNVARSLGDEPLAISQAVRARNAMTAIRMMERTLAQGKVSEQELAEVQELLEAERKHPAMLIALRGSRAFSHHVLTEVEAGKHSAAELQLLASGNYGTPGWKDEIQAVFFRRQVKPAHAWLLQYDTRAVEIVKQGGPDMEGKLSELQATRADAPELARQLAAKFDAPKFTLLKQCQAHAACACAALAAERFRLKHRRWPDALADLVTAHLLAEVPVDPFGNQPLQIRATKDGITILSTSPPVEGQRLEFRLWDDDKR